MVFVSGLPEGDEHWPHKYSKRLFEFSSFIELGDFSVMRRLIFIFASCESAELELAV